jgi:hypothetical protein
VVPLFRRAPHRQDDHKRPRKEAAFAYAIDPNERQCSNGRQPQQGAFSCGASRASHYAVSVRPKRFVVQEFLKILPRQNIEHRENGSTVPFEFFGPL